MSQVLKYFKFRQDALKSTGPFNLPDVQYYFQDGHPVVCLKKVADFESESLQEIHEIKQKLWNYGKIPFFYVYSDVEIRIYDCLEKPVPLEEMTALGETLADDSSKLKALVQVFSAQTLDTGSLWNQPEGEPFRKKISPPKPD